MPGAAFLGIPWSGLSIPCSELRTWFCKQYITQVTSWRACCGAQKKTRMQSMCNGTVHNEITVKPAKWSRQGRVAMKVGQP